MAVDPRRVRRLSDKPVGSLPVLYWMQRDQRVEDNWALLYAQEQAIKRGVPLWVLFHLVRIPVRATTRHYDFMLRGLQEVETQLAALHIPFFVITGDGQSVGDFVSDNGVGEVVTDFSPLRQVRARRMAVAEQLPCQLTEVDAHNIIPCWQASDKEEFAAYTFRPKVQRQLGDYLTPFPPLLVQPATVRSKTLPIDWKKIMDSLSLDTSVKPVARTPGSVAAVAALKDFVTHRLDTYHETRNDPTLEGVSGLSPYLHFGQLSAQRVALEISQAFDHSKEARDTFLEELIVRRELADNYCFYNQNYDKVSGAHVWAQTSIALHKHDPREYCYTRQQLEVADTHDDLWNAMQKQMVTEGKMHGWCRMYWAKKILEWTPDVQSAIDTALYLNDKYELDGLDPNGIVGVMWSVCGVHDRAWNERPIFGKIRYMNYAGAKRKFAVNEYIKRYGGTEKTLFN